MHIQKLMMQTRPTIEPIRLRLDLLSTLDFAGPLTLGH